MAIVRCPNCKQDKRSYAERFKHCGVLHISKDNLAFPPVQSSNAKSEVPKKEMGSEASEKSNVSQSPSDIHKELAEETETETDTDTDEVKQNSKSKESVSSEPVDLDVEDKEITEEEAKEKYECHHADCNAYFNKDEIIKEGDELKCPNCKEVIGEA